MRRAWPVTSSGTLATAGSGFCSSGGIVHQLFPEARPYGRSEPPEPATTKRIRRRTARTTASKVAGNHACDNLCSFLQSLQNLSGYPVGNPNLHLDGFELYRLGVLGIARQHIDRAAGLTFPAR